MKFKIDELGQRKFMCVFADVIKIGYVSLELRAIFEIETA